MKRSTIVVLILIFTFALFLRFWRLSIYLEAIARKAPQKLTERVEYSSEMNVRYPDGILSDNYANFWPTE
jgi:hypothetical protein